MNFYYATAGRGTEPFVVDELQQKLQCNFEDILTVDGKVFFSCPQTLTVLELKSVERVFVQIFYNGSFRWNKKKGFRRWYDNLEQISGWEPSYALWKRIQEETKARRDTERKTSNILCKETSCHAAEVSGSSDSKASSSANDNISESADSNLKSIVNKIQRLKREFFTVDDDEEGTSKSKKRLKREGTKSETSFRVSAKLSGNVLQSTSTQYLAFMLAKHIKKHTRWRTRRDWEIEICMQVTDHGLTLGIPLTKEPLSKRPYLHTHGMRSTIAWIMGKSAFIEPGDIVLDPMCGSGTILVEAAKEWKESMYIGIDNNPDQLQKAVTNIGTKNPNISLCQGDATILPFPLESIDKIVCDLPFGLKHNTSDDIKTLYSKTIKEMDRVLKMGGFVVLLTSSEMKECLKSLVIEKFNNQEAKDWNMCSCGKYRKGSASSSVVCNTVNSKENVSTKSNITTDYDNRLSKSDIPESDKQLDNPTSEHREPCVNTKISESGDILKSDIQKHEVQNNIEHAEGDNVDNKVEIDYGEGANPCDEYRVFELCPKKNCATIEITYKCKYSWILNKDHYLKLGETHSYMLVWRKRLTDAKCF